MKLLFFLLLLPGTLWAQSQVWNEGLHLLLGGGANLSDYHRNGDTVGAGLHFKTDVGYYFHEHWAVEAGSFVRFNKLHDTFIWDTLLTLGLRRRFEDHFVRAFVGKAPTVFYTDKVPETYQRSDSTRIQYTGPVVGLGWGEFLKTKKGTNWFWELSTSYQSLEKGQGIRNGTLPEVVFVTGREKIQIYTLSFSVGIMVF
jgi:hypothetical protein